MLKRRVSRAQLVEGIGILALFVYMAAVIAFSKTGMLYIGELLQFLFNR